MSRRSPNGRRPDDVPDSVVVQTPDGTLLTRSTAVLYLADRIGGWWRVLAKSIAVLPLWLLDRAYNGVARIRHRLFAKPQDLCPIVPPHLRQRFTDY